MARGRLRAVVLDASAAHRGRWRQLLERPESQLDVVGVAANGDQAIALAARHQSHVLLVGCGSGTAQPRAWVQQVMQTRPLPIVVVTAAGAHCDSADKAQLLAAGALSVVPEPVAGADFAPALEALIETVRLMSEVKVVRRWVGRTTAAQPAAPAAPGAPVAPRRRRRDRTELVAIGASTGGPIALRDVLCGLPRDFPAPIVIVQHMANGFVEGLVEWLSVSGSIPVEVARGGVQPEPGHAYFAPDHLHLRVAADGRLSCDTGPPVNGHLPAVSCLFGSVAARCGRHAIGILLTGMGKDGAAELKQMKDAGALTIAQDSATSVVHGMPGEAIRCGGASYVMSPREIAAALPALVMRQGEIDDTP